MNNPNSIQSQSASFKLKDATSYDAVTAQFDEFTHKLSLPFVSRMIALATVGPYDRILDVGTGTGIVALRMASAVPGARIIGIDLSEGMLATAQETSRVRRLDSAGHIEFHRMDAENLQFEDRSFDVVLSLFAVLHFPDPFAAISEMFRVLRPGGRIVLVVGSRPPLFSTAALTQSFRHIQQLALQRRGKLLSAPVFLNELVQKHLPPEAQGEESHLAHQSLDRTGGVLRLVQKAGFGRIQTSWSGHQAVLKTAQEFWSIQSTFSSIARKRLAAAPQDKVTDLRKEFFAICDEVKSRNGQFVYPMGAFFVSAEKPLA